MNKLAIISIILIIAISCGNRQKPAKELSPVTESVAVETADVFSLFDSTARTLPPHIIAEQVLTTEEAMLNAFPKSTDQFLHETTPASKVFFIPSDDIKDNEYVRTIQVRYNYAAVLNQVIHSLEWFERMTTGEEETISKADSLRWIRQARPTIPSSVLNKALPDPIARKNADNLLMAYSHFDGDTRDGSKFDLAIREYIAYFHSLPGEINQDYLEEFQECFWEWYDKKDLIPEIDDLVRMNMKEKPAHLPDEFQLENLKYAIRAESNIDRRTILALEYIKFHPGVRLDGAELLGEIIESRLYTKYLLEAWISWRANVQMDHSPSSFSVIANNYYDELRTICIDTFVRHCIQEEDKKAECLLENLLTGKVPQYALKSDGQLDSEFFQIEAVT